MQQVEQFLSDNKGRFVEELMALLRIPSVSGKSEHQPDMRDAAELVQRYLQDAGLSTEIVETDGHPIVYGEWLEAEGQPTVLVYGHYDVQPAEPFDEWTSPPFEPVVRDGKLFARGATDDKGQMLTHIKSVEAWMKSHGRLPVNVKFVIEGEEEVGSNNLEPYLSANKEKLACDIAVISDTSQYGPGMPAITYGLRGIMACEVTVTGPNRDLHSGVFGGSVMNPVNGLAKMVAALHDDSGRVQIPGFYDEIIPLTQTERDVFAALPFNEADYLANLGMDAVWGEEGFSTLERRWARPTCDVNGLFGGYTGEGPKTIVPSSATVKITCRLVPGQDPKKLTAALQQFLESQLSPGLKMRFQTDHGAAGIVVDQHSDYMAAAQRAIASAFGTKPVMIREGGSIPVVSTFRKLLGIDTLLLGWGLNTDNLHSPDEHFHVANFHSGTLASAYLWQELSRG